MLSARTGEYVRQWRGTWYRRRLRETPLKYHQFVFFSFIFQVLSLHSHSASHIPTDHSASCLMEKMWEDLMPKLTSKQVIALRAPGRHADGEGLYLMIGPTGGKSWVLRTVVSGRRRDFGLGSAKLVQLREARETASKFRKIARAGGDPRIFLRPSSMTFSEAARKAHRIRSRAWTSERHTQIWISSLERYAFPHFGDRPIEQIGSPDIYSILEPIWAEKYDTANRVLQRISTVFNWARVSDVSTCGTEQRI